MLAVWGPEIPDGSPDSVGHAISLIRDGSQIGNSFYKCDTLLLIMHIHFEATLHFINDPQIIILYFIL